MFGGGIIFSLVAHHVYQQVEAYRVVIGVLLGSEFPGVNVVLPIVCHKPHNHSLLNIERPCAHLRCCGGEVAGGGAGGRIDIQSFHGNVQLWFAPLVD